MTLMVSPQDRHSSRGPVRDQNYPEPRWHRHPRAHLHNSKLQILAQMALHPSALLERNKEKALVLPWILHCGVVPGREILSDPPRIELCHQHHVRALRRRRARWATAVELQLAPRRSIRDKSPASPILLQPKYPGNLRLDQAQRHEQLDNRRR